MDLLEKTRAICEDPGDVLRVALAWAKSGRCVALAVLTQTEGGAVRAPGALMAISQSGAIAGYLSGGCIDADIALRAQQAMKTGKACQLRYGKGSPFVDIKLPCGGALDILICPDPSFHVIETVTACLAKRRPSQLSFDREGAIVPGDSTSSHTVLRKTYLPKLRLRVAGRGPDFIALARLASASGFSCLAQSPDAEDLAAIAADRTVAIEQLVTPGLPPTSHDDPWTGFALMFHDRDWELPLLQHVLQGEAFYIGAVGSRATHARRREALVALGLSMDTINRIRGPIGLVPRMRDASMLAVSALAEIVAAFDEAAA